MVNYPTILGLPQEDIARQLYVGVLGLESRVKALENKPKPTPTQSGTVTVTVLDGDDNDAPFENATVFLCSTDDVPGQSDDNVVAYGKTDANGESTLVLWDTSTHQPTEVDDIPFGNYYLIVNENGFKTYDEAFTVDGDETVTITLTSE
jgi:hypothetical protein